jgi:hypothetical protein
MHMTSGTSPEHPANDIATHAVFLSSTWTRHGTFGGNVGRGILLIDCITAFPQKYLLNLSENENSCTRLYYHRKPRLPLYMALEPNLTRVEPPRVSVEHKPLNLEDLVL